MSTLLLIAVCIWLVMKYGAATILWTGGILLVILFAAWLFRDGGAKEWAGKTSERPRVRIDHPHYASEDESECTICGKRIPAYAPRCPNCVVRFNASKEDEDEWDEEFDEMESWDEEEGR